MAGRDTPPIPSFKPKPDTQRGIKTVLHEKVVIMICRYVLYCIVLYCIVLYCIVLYCIVLYCIV